MIQNIPFHSAKESYSVPWSPSKSRLLQIAAVVVLVLAPSAGRSQTSPYLEPHLVADVAPGFPGSSIEYLCPIREGSGGGAGQVANRLLFTSGGDAALYPLTLWVTDGTPGGTALLGPPGGSALLFARCLDHGAFFRGTHDSYVDDALWWTDGTPDGTVSLIDLAFSVVSEELPDGRFLVTGQAKGSETRGLWVTDRTPDGTLPLPLALPGPERPLASSGTVKLGDRALIYGLAPESGDLPETILLWVSDGTVAGTSFVRELGSGPKRLRAIVRVGDRVLILVQSVAESPWTNELWVSDGTPGGTTQVPVDLPENTISSFTQVVSTPAGERLVFVTHTGTSEQAREQLWVSDGTAAGTVMLLENPQVRPGAVAINRAIPLVERDGLFYFTHDDDVHGAELWATDLTPEGTGLVMDLCAGPCSSDARLLRPYGDRTLLEARAPGAGDELWISDLTVAGTRMLSDLCPGSCSSEPHDFLEPQGAGGGVLFAARPGPQTEVREQLWRLPPPDPDRSPLEWPPPPRATTAFTGGGFHARRPMGPFAELDHQILFVHGTDVYGSELWSLPLQGFLPELPAGPFLESARVPGFRFKVRIKPNAGTDAISGQPEGTCIPETVCASGAVAGRSEVFLRVVGPKPNGYLWPTLVKFSTSAVEVWVEQKATGTTRWYLLPGAAPGVDELPGLFDRFGFIP